MQKLKEFMNLLVENQVFQKSNKTEAYILSWFERMRSHNGKEVVPNFFKAAVSHFGQDAKAWSSDAAWMMKVKS